MQMSECMRGENTIIPEESIGRGDEDEMVDERQPWQLKSSDEGSLYMNAM